MADVPGSHLYRRHETYHQPTNEGLANSPDKETENTERSDKPQPITARHTAARYQPIIALPHLTCSTGGVYINRLYQRESFHFTHHFCTHSLHSLGLIRSPGSHTLCGLVPHCCVHFVDFGLEHCLHWGYTRLSLVTVLDLVSSALLTYGLQIFPV